MIFLDQTEIWPRHSNKLGDGESLDLGWKRLDLGPPQWWVTLWTGVLAWTRDSMGLWRQP